MDNVFFDANSFTSGSQTVSLPTDASCRNMNWTGSTNNPTLEFTGSSNRVLGIYGSLTLVPGMTLYYPYSVGRWHFRGNTTGITLTSAGKDLSFAIFEAAGGEWTLQDALTAGSFLFVLEGTFNTNNFTINTGEFNSTTGCGGCNIRTVNLGSSIINCSTKWNIFGTSLTLNTGTSTIRTPYFQSIATATYNNVEMNGTTVNEIRVTGTPVVMNNLDMTAGTSLDFTGSIGWDNITVNNRLGLNQPGSTISFMASSVITVAGPIVLPDPGPGCSALTILRTNVSGTAASISKSSGSVTASRLSLKDITATGGASFTANYSVDAGGNSGWTISSPSTATFYWIGDGGNWHDASHWSSSSGGASSGCIPTQLDHVVFDANSFSTPGQVVSLDADANCSNMNWTGVLNNPALAFSGSSNRRLSIYGSLTLVPSMSVTYPYAVGVWAFNSSSAGNTVTSAGKDLMQARFEGTSGGWTLQDPLTASQFVFVLEGTFNTNNFTINTGEFNSTTGCGGCNIRTINLGSSTINCTQKWNIFNSGITLNTGTSVINAASFTSGGQTYNNVILNGTTGIPTLSVSSDVFNNLTINTTINTEFSGSGPMTINNNFIINGPAKIISIKPSAQINLNGSMTVNSSPSVIITMQSLFNGIQAIISKSSGSVCVEYATLKDMNATGGAVFYAANSTNNGNNTGWNFIAQSCLAILPVNLISFNVSCTSNAVLCNWKTTSESNSSHFEIEKQTASGWNVIGLVNANGFSQTLTDYRFLSVQDDGGSYRLVSVDRDGHRTYTDIKHVQCGKEYYKIKILSNPVVNMLTGNINSSKKQTVSLRVIGSTGQVISKKEISLLPGVNNFEINVSKLSAGKYLLQVISPESSEQLNFIKIY